MTCRAVFAAIVIGALPTAAHAQTPCTAITLSMSPTKPQPPAPNVAMGGGTAFVYVTGSTPGCTWTASTAVPWVTFPDGANGAGTGWFRIAAAPNTSGFFRQGNVVITANVARNFNVTQFGSPDDGPGAMQSPAGWTASPSTATVAQPFKVSGFAIDANSTSGPGLANINIYWVDNTGTHLIGPATYGIPHQHAADRLGSQFLNSGYELDVSGIPTTGTVPAGSGVSIQAFGTSTVDGHLVAAGASRVTVIDPVLNVAPSTLQFGASNGNGSLTTTASQNVTLSGFGVNLAWTATTTDPWIRLSQASGTGPNFFTVAVDAPSLPSSGTLFGTVHVSVPGLSAGQFDLPVRVDVYSSFATAAPFGAFDPPPSPATGAVPITGWALDDVGVAGVAIYRSRSASEGAGGLVFIGNATFTDGARSDVAAAFPSAPQKTRAGWGYMLLSNVLPGGGNETFTFYAYATDVEGKQTLLGARPLMLTNASAEAPFGALDVPSSGETVSGVVTIAGWVVSPSPGSITNVYVAYDGQIIGLAQYGIARPDVAALFSGPNVPPDAAAAGFRFTIDTRGLANGLHTIAVLAASNIAGFAGIGSRFFTVKNP